MLSARVIGTVARYSGEQVDDRLLTVAVASSWPRIAVKPVPTYRRRSVMSSRARVETGGGGLAEVADLIDIAISAAGKNPGALGVSDVGMDAPDAARTAGAGSRASIVAPPG
jgi:hypothetical protein